MKLAVFCLFSSSFLCTQWIYLCLLDQVAAGTLDASTKIYAVRVDAVHADVYRVLGGLGRDAASPEEAESHDAGIWVGIWI